MNALGVDVSRWQRTIDWKTLRTVGVSFAIIKASQGVTISDGLLHAHFSGARQAGLVTGVFHWVDPTLPPTAQVDHFLKTCQGLDFDFAALDVEQHWQSWQEWARNQIVQRVPPERISRAAHEAAVAVRAATDKPVVIYTRPSFVQEYAQPMLAWLPEWPLWLAYYPYPAGKVWTNWENLVNKHLPRIPGPKLPPGCSNWRFWQFSGDKFVLPGAVSPLDLNYFNGDEAELRAWVGQKGSARVEISDSEKLTRLWQAHPELRQP